MAIISPSMARSVTENGDIFGLMPAGNAGGKGQPVRAIVLLHGFIGVLLCANAASTTSTPFLLGMSECLSVAVVPKVPLQIVTVRRQRSRKRSR